MSKLNGIELIIKEREEQLNKHKISVEKDIDCNNVFQLSIAAVKLADPFVDLPSYNAPDGWDDAQWQYMIDKPYKDRLIIAGALIASELDRLSFED